jgi:hypothetical protein
MNKNIVLAGFAASIVAASLTSSLAAGAATNSNAKSIKATTSCGEIKVNLSGFTNLRSSNRAIASLDGTKVVDHKFASTYSFVFYADEAYAHTVKVSVADRAGQVTSKTFRMAPCTAS